MSTSQPQPESPLLELLFLELPPDLAALDPAAPGLAVSDLAVSDLIVSDPTLALDIERACRNNGFFYLAQSNLFLAQVDQAFEQVKAFFAQPIEAKRRVLRSPQTNCGYVPLQAESLDPQRPGDYKEAFNIGPETIWPDLPEFQTKMSAFYRDCIEQLARPLLQALALALELPVDFFVQRHQNNFFLRLLHYPTLPPATAVAPPRAGAHTDYGTVTLLFQEQGPSNPRGLEILTQQGNWLALPFQPGKILVNIGDALQRWTGDEWRSTPHRVVLPPGNPSRYTMALFCDPDPDVEIAALPNRSAAHPPILYRDYLQSRFEATYGP